LRLADNVARRCIAERELQGQWRPLTHVALTIWLTRNWTAEQLVAKAKELGIAEREAKLKAQRPRAPMR